MSELDGNTSDFASLSLKDLLEARDLYHFHLMNRTNVVGTAVGRYLIRKDRAADATHSPRTFENSEVRANSWPCILVLVSEWVRPSDFRTGDGALHPTEMVPSALFLPDGRKVPVCVVLIIPAVASPPSIPNWVWPSSYFGPGFPVMTDVQGQVHRATVGALVTDGHTLYGLTSQHVSGRSGEPIYAMTRARRQLIGRASERQGGRVPLSDCYPEFPSRRTFINMDVGLFEVTDASQWTSQVYGLGAIGPLADLNEANIRLRLIDAKVVAFGGSSGRLDGKIAGLFYRYKAVAGFDYVADFLIAPTSGDGTQPGDSGAVWHLVPSTPGDLLLPIAVEWGGQASSLEGGRQHRFALATSLSSVCKHLDVDLVRIGDTGAQPYWGQTGHYDIAHFACDAISSPKLKTLMDANIENVSFAANSLSVDDIASAITDAKANQSFVPLADVPDVVWKNLPSKFRGGRDTKPSPHGSTGPEHPTHFADIDEPWAAHDDQTLRELCVNDPSNVSLPVWRAYYDANGHTTQTSRGLLPFRVWQHFKAMTAAVAAGDVATFVAAAGTLSHYVGDACQPLHGSMNADGFKDQPITVTHHKRDTGEAYTTESLVGAGVHSGYESKMVDKYSPDILTGFATGLAHANVDPLDPINSGRDAAIATVKLMDRAARRLPPRELIQTFVDAGGKPNNKSLAALWDKWGARTIDTMADGARVLAFLWDAAWRVGNGDRFGGGDLMTLDRDALRAIYEDPKFVPSLDLDSIDAAL